MADRNLGSLARWLRLLGVDVLYPEAMEDEQLLRFCRREGKILLTRDRRLAEANQKRVYLVQANDVEEQVREVVGHFGLGRHLDPLSRCSVCNTPIQAVEKSEVQGKVPPKVYEFQEEFWRCPGCGKIYWQGTHWERMKEKIQKILHPNKG